MGNISSANFKKSKTWQIYHNSDIRPSYAIGGKLECNRNATEALALKNQIVKEAKEAYTARTKQKFQAKSYEWSLVVNLKESSTMQDLENLSKHFIDKYGFQCYQIAIHRDEGHINEQGEKIINHHAHLEFITLDKQTGKNNYRREIITPQVLRNIQDEVSEILQMERGVDKRLSGAKRIEPRVYGAMKEKEKLEHRQKTKKNKDLQVENEFLKLKNIELEKEILTQKAIRNEFTRLRQVMIEWGICDKDDYKITLAGALNEALKFAKEKQFSKDDLDFTIARVKNEIQRKHNVEIYNLQEKLKNSLKIIESQKSDIEQLQKEKIDLRANFVNLTQEQKDEQNNPTTMQERKTMEALDSLIEKVSKAKEEMQESLAEKEQRKRRFER